MTPKKFHTELKRHVDKNGGVNEYSRKLKVSSGYISQLYTGVKQPSKLVLNDMGYEKQVKTILNYVEVKK